MEAAFYLLNFITLGLYPVVWADDILWTEPAINLIRTGHFTTSVFQMQPADTFWAAQSPLYPLVLSLWLRVTGFSLVAIKSFNLLLVLAAAFLAWMAAWKFRLVNRPWARMAIVPLIWMGYGMSFAYRSSRPDMAGLISLLALWLAFASRSRWRPGWIFLAAAMTSWVGVQVALYASWACLLAKWLFGEVKWRDVFLTGAGIVCGAVSLLLFYQYHGAVQYFFASLTQAANEHTTWGAAPNYLGSIPRRLKGIWNSYYMDFSVLPLLAGLAVLRGLARGGFSPGVARGIKYLLAVFITIPILFNFTGHFAFYYAYMLYVPIVLAFAAAYADVAWRTGLQAQLARWIFPAGLMAAMLIGLPLRLFLSTTFCEVVPRAEYLREIEKHVRAEDVVFCDYPAFFEAKQAVQRVYSPMYARYFVNLSPRGHEFSEVEKQGLTVLIVRPERIDDLSRYFGGSWTPVSAPFGDSLNGAAIAKVPVIGARLQNHFAAPQMSRYQLQVFRRTP